MMRTTATMVSMMLAMALPSPMRGMSTRMAPDGAQPTGKRPPPPSPQNGPVTVS